MSDESKVAIVTGSALNIGRAIALHLARDGFSVIVTARQAEHDATETARLVREAGCDAVRAGWSRQRPRGSAGSMCWSTTHPCAARRGSPT
jgi:NAD(P)-dependent dehydrogenase (short-subunit alcohol dehydrogenase family)